MKMSRVFCITRAVTVGGIGVVKRARVLCLPVMVSGMIVMSNVTINAETVNLMGKVSNTAGEPIANAIVTVVSQGLKDTTGADGIYTINSTPVLSPIKLLSQSRKIVLENGSLKFNLPEPSTVKVEFFTIEGKLLKREVLLNATSGFYRFKTDKKLHTNILIIRTSIGQYEFTFRYIQVHGKYLVNQSNENFTSVGGKLAKLTDIIDTLIISANKYLTKKTPIASYDQQLDVTLDTSLINGNIIFSEGFEGTNLTDAGFRVAYRGPDYGWMTITDKAGHNNSTHSLMSDSNKTGIRKILSVDQFIKDSIAGLEFYLMAKKAGQTEVYSAFGQGGNSAGMLPNGWQTVFGMGIDTSDSLWCLYEKYSYPQADSDLVHKRCGALEVNKWFKCAIEYDFNKTMLTYSLNDTVVYTKIAPNRTIEEFIVYRDTCGAQGPKDYYFDDVTMYKR
jgi:hypothetical protein